MKDDFDYRLVPSNYIHCFNQACPFSGNCLRHLAALQAPKTHPYVVTVNPAAYPEDAARCPHFKSSAKIRFAWGLTTTFDNIPYKTALLLKKKNPQPLFQNDLLPHSEPGTFPFTGRTIRDYPHFRATWHHLSSRIR